MLKITFAVTVKVTVHSVYKLHGVTPVHDLVQGNLQAEVRMISTSAWAELVYRPGPPGSGTKFQSC